MMNSKERLLLKNGLTLALKVNGEAYLEKEDLEEVISYLERLEELESKYKPLLENHKQIVVESNKLLIKYAKLERVIDFLKRDLDMKLEVIEYKNRTQYNLLYADYEECFTATYEITKEQYELLKEVLQDE